jgi:hypothetical protein
MTQGPHPMTTPTEDDRVAALERRMAALENAAAEQWPWFRMHMPNYLPGSPMIIGPVIVRCRICGMAASICPTDCSISGCPTRVA